MVHFTSHNRCNKVNNKRDIILISLIVICKQIGRIKVLKASNCVLSCDLMAYYLGN